MSSSPKITDEAQAGKALAVDATSLIVSAVKTAAMTLLRDPELRAELASLLSEVRTDRAPAEVAAAHLTRKQYAARSGISEATVSRLVRDGLPVVGVGTTYRIDSGAADEWRRARGRSTPTRASVKSAPDVEVDDVLASAGLRLVAAGGRR